MARLSRGIFKDTRKTSSHRRPALEPLELRTLLALVTFDFVAGTGVAGTSSDTASLEAILGLASTIMSQQVTIPGKVSLTVTIPVTSGTGRSAPQATPRPGSGSPFPRVGWRDTYAADYIRNDGDPLNPDPSGDGASNLRIEIPSSYLAASTTYVGTDASKIGANQEDFLTDLLRETVQGLGVMSYEQPGTGYPEDGSVPVGSPFDHFDSDYTGSHSIPDSLFLGGKAVSANGGSAVQFVRPTSSDPTLDLTSPGESGDPNPYLYFLSPTESADDLLTYHSTGDGYTPVLGSRELPSSLDDAILEDLVGANTEFASAGVSVPKTSGTAEVNVAFEGPPRPQYSVIAKTVVLAGDTAVGGVDFTSTSQSLTLGDVSVQTGVGPVGSIVQNAPFDVSILDNPHAGPDRTLHLQLFNSDGSTLLDQIRLTITDLGPAPAISVATPSPVVAVSGVSAEFVVSLTHAANFPVTVTYATVDGTAKSPANYAFKSGTLTFPSGTTTQTLLVPISRAMAAGPNTSFSLVLTYAANGTIATGQATETIVDSLAPLVANDAAYEILEGHTLTLAAPGILNSVSAPSGVILTAAAGTEPSHGSLSIQSNGSLTYSPAASFIGVDSFVYTASDGSDSPVSATVRIVVQAPEPSGAPVGFDEQYYLAEYPDVRASVAAGQFSSGYQQFVQVGQQEGRNPSAFFDEKYYLAENPDVARAVAQGTFASGFQHFILYGEHEGRNPSPYFNQAFYLAEYPDVAAAVAAGTLTSGFEHYVLYGQYDGRDPSPAYDENDYLNQDPDVAAAVAAGLFTSGYEHYIMYGQEEGRNPSSFFNAKFYLATYPDVAAAIGKPVGPGSTTLVSGYEHFLLYGQGEGRNPSPYFDAPFYLSQNPDVAAAVAAGTLTSGFEHYILYGQHEGRDATPVFDEGYYLASNADVAAAVAAGRYSSGYEHFVLHGQTEGRDLSTLYNEQYYLATNADVAAAVASGIFVSGYEHFLEYGLEEGRIPIGDWNEANYLAANPDVATAVKDHVLASGFEHYVLYGRRENRLGGLSQ